MSLTVAVGVAEDRALLRDAGEVDEPGSASRSSRRRRGGAGRPRRAATAARGTPIATIIERRDVGGPERGRVAISREVCLGSPVRRYARSVRAARWRRAPERGVGGPALRPRAGGLGLHEGADLLRDRLVERPRGPRRGAPRSGRNAAASSRSTWSDGTRSPRSILEMYAALQPGNASSRWLSPDASRAVPEPPPHGDRVVHVGYALSLACHRAPPAVSRGNGTPRPGACYRPRSTSVGGRARIAGRPGRTRPRDARDEDGKELRVGLVSTSPSSCTAPSTTSIETLPGSTQSVRARISSRISSAISASVRVNARTMSARVTIPTERSVVDDREPVDGLVDHQGGRLVDGPSGPIVTAGALIASSTVVAAILS